MVTIRISKRVYEKIAKRGKFGETPNDVLESVFKIEKKAVDRRNNRTNLLPPDGTECRLKHRGNYIYGKINNEELIIKGVGVYSSFSTPASELRGTSSNGWLYWKIKLPGSSVGWISADKWRKSQISKKTKQQSPHNIKSSWFDATLNAVQRYCERHDRNEFKLKDLITEELEYIVKATRTKGKTPINTLQYYLQRLRDKDEIEFIDNKGSYRRLKNCSSNIRS